jgi:hypothetical protein
MRKGFFPKFDDPLLTGRAKLIAVTSLGLMLAAWALVLTWLISGDLEGITVVAAAIFSAVMFGLMALARHGRVSLAAWLLVGLLSVLILADTVDYGLSSPSIVSYLVPIVLAACTLGLAAGIGVAAFGSIGVWLIAIALSAGWYQSSVPFTFDQLTFNAPVLTVIFLLVAGIVGWWSRYTTTLMSGQRTH